MHKRWPVGTNAGQKRKRSHREYGMKLSNRNKRNGNDWLTPGFHDSDEAILRGDIPGVQIMRRLLPRRENQARYRIVFASCLGSF